MANDILNTKLPNDDFNAADSNFANDTSVNGATPPETEPKEGLTPVDQELADIDTEILENLYPDPEPGEFVFGRNIQKGLQGVNSNALGIIVGHIALPVAPTISENTQSVSGMYGQRWLGNNYGAKVFNIPVTVIAKNGDEYLQNVEQMSNTLIKLGNEEIPMVFGAYPDRTYYGHFTAIPEPAYINPGAWDSTLTLQFTCSDPHGYLDVEIDAADNQNKLNLTPKGNDIAKPLFHFEFNKDSNNFGYTNDKGEYVFVGYADEDNPKDLMPLVYNDPIEDPATFTHITDMSTQNWALANARATTDGTMRSQGGYGLAQLSYWTVPKDYTGNATAFGNVLQTKKFNVGANGNYKLSTRMAHLRYYDRAYQRIEAYLIGTDGHKIGRMGMQDYGGGGLTYIYIVFGKTVAEEQANLANGFGYYGTGNTEWARAQINQKPGYSVSITGTDNNVNMSVDRQKTTQFTQVLYDTSKYDWNPNNHHLQDAIKWTHYTKTVEEWKTPRDSSGKATGKQQYQKKVEVDWLRSTTVPINKIVNRKNVRLNYDSYQDYRVDNLVWGSAVGRTSYWSTWHNKMWWDKKWKWWTSDYQHGTEVDKKNARVNQIGSVTNKTDLGWDYNDSSALTRFWGNFEVTRIDGQIAIKVFEIGDEGLQTNNVVLDQSFKIPSGFDAKIGQIAYFFGKTPIHEDKITKTTAATSDTPASWEHLKSYPDDNLFVSTLDVHGLTTADALKKAHTIIHAGDTADIDTETENVYINGALANQYLSPASTYPLFHGGSQEQISFQPTADKASVTYVYRPALK